VSSAASEPAPRRPLRYAVLASGGGSNFQALLDATGRGDLNAQAAFLAGNNSGAGAMKKARTAGIPAYHISAKTEGSEDGVASRLLALLDEYGPDLLVLAGYMKKVPDAVLERMKNRVVNIHPALLPNFGGAGMYGHYVHEAVVAAAVTAAGMYLTGMTIHMVNENYDEGQILVKRAEDVFGLDATEVARRVLVLEHDTYWRTLKGFSDGDIVPTDSDVPSRAVLVSDVWKQYMRTLDGIDIP
jgi:phosphoribosylglycinamide formyltransferase-1